MTGKRKRNRAADKASIPGPTYRKKRKEDPWIDKLNDELTLCTADLTENEEVSEDSLDPSAHMICQPTPSDHNPYTVSGSSLQGVEKEDVD